MRFLAALNLILTPWTWRRRWQDRRAQRIERLRRRICGEEMKPQEAAAQLQAQWHAIDAAQLLAWCRYNIPLWRLPEGMQAELMAEVVGRRNPDDA